MILITEIFNKIINLRLLITWNNIGIEIMQECDRVEFDSDSDGKPLSASAPLDSYRKRGYCQCQRLLLEKYANTLQSIVAFDEDIINNHLTLIFCIKNPNYFRINRSHHTNLWLFSHRNNMALHVVKLLMAVQVKCQLLIYLLARFVRGNTFSTFCAIFQHFSSVFLIGASNVTKMGSPLIGRFILSS